LYGYLFTSASSDSREKTANSMYSLYTNPYSGGNGKMFVQRVGPIIYVFVMVRGWAGVKRCGVGYIDFDFF
jgi:hypothetical protein